MKVNTFLLIALVALMCSCSDDVLNEGFSILCATCTKSDLLFRLHHCTKCLGAISVA